MTNDTLQDFQDHQFSYERAHQIGLFERKTAEAMKDLYSENRTESYYGGGRPTEEQAEAMTDPRQRRPSVRSRPRSGKAASVYVTDYVPYSTRLWIGIHRRNGRH